MRGIIEVCNCNIMGVHVKLLLTALLQIMPIICIDRYNIVKNRSNIHGGGVLLYTLKLVSSTL